MVFVDSNVILDVVTRDPLWSAWSVDQLDRASPLEDLIINQVVYAEVSVGYDRFEEVDELVAGMRLVVREAPRPALFLAAKVHRRYRRGGGPRLGILPNFFIGAHAAVIGATLLTRDPRRYRAFFPTLELIAP
jgi:hypothetical protein